MVRSFEAVTPLPALSLPFARSGGQGVAQAPEHALFVLVSLLNRYSVRPRESTRILPSLLLLATRTFVTACRAAMVECGAAALGGACAAVAPPPPPQAATPSATSGTAAAPSRVNGFLVVMLAPSGDVL